MTFSQLQELTEDELDMTLYIVNVINPLHPPMEISPQGLTWFRRGALEKRLIDAFPQVKSEFHPIYVSLLEKLGIKVEINQHQSPTINEVSASNDVSGSQPTNPEIHA